MKENQKIIGMHYLKGWIRQMIESNVLTSIVEGVLEDLEKRRIPISKLNEQLKSAPDLRGAYKSLSKPGMRLIAEIKDHRQVKALWQKLMMPNLWQVSTRMVALM
jgi:hypothetical protein